MTSQDPYGLSHTYGELLAEAARIAGNEERDPETGALIPPTDKVDLSQAEQVVRNAIAEFVGEHEWQFRLQTIQLTIGTDATNESVVVDGDAGRYKLPWYFQGAGYSDVWTYTSDSTYRKVIKRVLPQEIDRLRGTTTVNGDPTVFAYRKLPPNGHGPTGWEVIFYPTPSSTETIQTDITASPTAMRETSDCFFAGEEYNLALLRCVEKVAAEEYMDDADLIAQAQQRYANALRQALGADRRTKPRNSGKLSKQRFNRGMKGNSSHLSRGTINVNGTEID